MKVFFQLTNEAFCLTRHHQSSLLAAVWQGEEGYETAAKRSDMVRINSVPHTVDIHLPDPKVALRNPVQGQ